MTIDIALSLLAVFIVTVVISKYLRLSPKYDRKPREKSPWQKLDHGDDPTEDQ